MRLGKIKRQNLFYLGIEAKEVFEQRSYDIFSVTSVYLYVVIKGLVSAMCQDYICLSMGVWGEVCVYIQ